MSDPDSRHAGRASSRERLLDAAQQLVAEHGVQQLTIDGVAAAAGVTKGGLIYHFKTRDDLLAALLERMVGQYDLRGRTQQARGAAPSPRALLQALTNATFKMADDDKKLLSRLLAAASTHQHLMDPARSLFADVYDELAGSGEHAGLALLLAAALDGVTLLELLDLHHFSKTQGAAMRRALKRLTSELP